MGKSITKLAVADFYLKKETMSFLDVASFLCEFDVPKDTLELLLKDVQIKRDSGSFSELNSRENEFSKGIEMLSNHYDFESVTIILEILNIILLSDLSSFIIQEKVSFEFFKSILPKRKSFFEERKDWYLLQNEIVYMLGLTTNNQEEEIELREFIEDTTKLKEFRLNYSAQKFGSIYLLQSSTFYKRIHEMIIESAPILPLTYSIVSPLKFTGDSVCFREPIQKEHVETIYERLDNLSYTLKSILPESALKDSYLYTRSNRKNKYFKIV